MADAFIGEIRMFPFGYAPIGWLACDGQRVDLRQAQALYSLLGSRFGGDSRTYFNVPNLNGRIPVNMGASPMTGTPFVFADKIGQETVTLSYGQAPTHSHSFTARISGASITGMTGVAKTTGTGSAMVGNSLLSRAINSAGKTINAFDVPPSAVVSNLGVKVSVAYGNAQTGTDPHANVQPYLVMAYYICSTDGTYPPRPD